MDKESVYLFQKLNCNCNDCSFMVRDFSSLEEAKEKAKTSEESMFDRTTQRRMQEAWDLNASGKHKKCSNLIKEVRKRIFTYNQTSTIMYGDCTLKKKKVTFIADDIQLDTQECFKHRKDKL